MDAMNVARYIQDGPYMMQSRDDTWLVGLFRLLMLALVVAGVVWVAKILVERSNTTSSESSRVEPLDIAKERFAKGEITKAQLDEIRKELSK